MRVLQILFYHFVYFALRYLPQKSQTQHSFTQFARSPIKYPKVNHVAFTGKEPMSTYQISPRDEPHLNQLLILYYIKKLLTVKELLIGEVP